MSWLLIKFECRCIALHLPLCICVSCGLFVGLHAVLDGKVNKHLYRRACFYWKFRLEFVENVHVAKWKENSMRTVVFVFPLNNFHSFRLPFRYIRKWIFCSVTWHFAQLRHRLPVWRNVWVSRLNLWLWFTFKISNVNELFAIIFFLLLC